MQLKEVDMHTHSCYSDGSDSPRKIVLKAAAKKLRAVCLTDHDTLCGLDEFMKAGRDFGIETVAGVEISSRYEKTDVHILGYHINHRKRDLLEKKLHRNQKTERRRMEIVLQKYAEAELMAVTAKDVRRLTNCKGPNISLMHIRSCRTKISKIKFEKTKNETWRGGVAWAKQNDNFIMTPTEAVNTIRDAGGIAVLAHPGEFYYRTDGKKEDGMATLVELLKKIKKDIVAIEAYHPKHTAEQAHLFVRLAKEMGLLVTGGSDYHGHFKSRVEIGCQGISYKNFLKFNINKISY